MDEARLLELGRELVSAARRAGADEAEVATAWTSAVETRLEANDIHTVESQEEASFGLRVLTGGSLGFVTGNDLDPAYLQEAAAEAVAQAKAKPADDNNGFPEPRPLEPVDGLFDDSIAGITVTDTTELASQLAERIRSSDERVQIDSGAVSASITTSAIVTSTGIEASEKDGSAQVYVFGMAVDGEEVASFDYDSDTKRNRDDLTAACTEIADRFTQKCLAGLGAGAGESFKGTVILSPEAVAEFLLPNLVSRLCADTVRKGQSPLASKLGTCIATDSFTLVDDGRIPGGIASSAFDREGLPTLRRVLVNSGVLESFLWNYYEARAAGGSLTGNASGGVGTLPGVGPSRLEMSAGDTPEAELAAGAAQAVIVNRFSGSTNPVTGDFSGVVKNGHLVANGSSRPIKETMIAGNLYELLGNISAMSHERRELNGSVLVPAVRAEGISVTAG